MENENRLQYTLIGLGVVTTVLLAVFFYRELFPEYRIYQNDYLALEKFRSTYTHEPPPPFKEGIQQIVLEQENRGPPLIDRCTSCHVALQVEAFSPTRLQKDSQGKILEDSSGIPLKEPNPEYVWAHLDTAIAELEKEGKKAAAQKYRDLKVAHVGEHTYDVTKVLAMHPLMGKETRPFQYHPVEEYGCVTCHNGNGRGLVTDRAHGPVWDGQYEEEFRGFVPKFLEEDPENDPAFSKVFNAKPGHRLLFQTTPLYVGALMQAKCVQCHQSAQEVGAGEGATQEEEHTAATQVDLLTKEYKQGQELFITQGCYACHKIAGFARGGVGPELTHSAESYPWYIKESIVWPQADLKTSTMPNYHLDHEEVEALMTFLLGQTDKKQGVAQTSYKTSIRLWEAGQKRAFEQPATVQQMHSLDYGMTTFAVEGCASCHRLRGYVGNVEAKDTAWFMKLFPEDITGSELVAVLEKHGNELDSYLVEQPDKTFILEKIEKAYPGVIESFYSNFKYAARAKNATGDPVRISAWKKRVDQLLKVYIRVYGLGRVVGPRPNWTGVYRSDEWLMEHFKNPSGHVARSIMPTFPFDDTKFYALTWTLDQLARENVKQDYQLREQEGFRPEKAYALYCAQCHGEQRLGNGPVAEWIYPIPKNLSSPDFLRSLTKERVAYAITHGVAGTPMAPWGELGEGKPFANTEPVFTHKQVQELVDWLFATLPGATVIQHKDDIPKWQYMPKDVEDELKAEKGSSFEALFRQEPRPEGSPDPIYYYIKKSYYTPANIEAGRRFFVENCASCHGKEADGSGLRAEAMSDAKPRMLTNFDWIRSQDDLRLLRSIKYGVPGTSMTPWGDLTNTEQRLQLVVFLRSLSEEKQKRTLFQEALYRHFDQPLLAAKAKGDQKLAENLEVRKELMANFGAALINAGADEVMVDQAIRWMDKGAGKESETDLKNSIEAKIASLAEEKKELDSASSTAENKEKIRSLEAQQATWDKVRVLQIRVGESK